MDDYDMDPYMLDDEEPIMLTESDDEARFDADLQKALKASMEIAGLEPDDLPNPTAASTKVQDDAENYAEYYAGRGKWADNLLGLCFRKGSCVS